MTKDGCSLRIIQLYLFTQVWVSRVCCWWWMCFYQKKLKLLWIDFVTVHTRPKWQQILKVSNLLVNNLLYLNSVLLSCCHWNTFTECCDPPCNSNFRTYHTTGMDISKTYLLSHICLYHKFILQCIGTYEYKVNTCTAVDLYLFNSTCSSFAWLVSLSMVILCAPPLGLATVI